MSKTRIASPSRKSSFDLEENANTVAKTKSRNSFPRTELLREQRWARTVRLPAIVNSEEGVALDFSGIPLNLLFHIEH